jgi:type IV pilus assembly protein PilC
MPLLRGLRTLHEQEENRTLRSIIAELSDAIEGGASYAEALAKHPKTFSALYINMVKAGELSGALDITLKRLAEFMEKAQRIRGKVAAALFYPGAVLLVAGVILVLMMTFVVPRFQDVFTGLLNNKPMPAFTLLVLQISQVVKNNFVGSMLTVAGSWFLLWLGLRTGAGRLLWDNLKLRIPALGPVFRKLAIARMTRTFGTLMGSGVPVLQALAIIQRTTGNVVIGNVVARIHEAVKEGEAIAPTLKGSGVFPPMVAGMVDVGEQTGSLPEMLMKVADCYDEQVDNATSAMTSLLEPILIVVLAVVVGSIVIAMFLPIIRIMTDFGAGTPGEAE